MLNLAFWYLPVGHTHNRCDQRFSSVAHTLSTAECLQNPSEFAAWIRMRYKPARAYGLEVDVERGQWDAKEFLSALPFRWAGLFGDDGRASGAAHCFRIVQARDVNTYDLPHEVENGFEEFQSVERSPTDAILFAKHRISSRSLSQPPMLVLPTCIANRCIWERFPAVSACNTLLPTSCKQYARTARAIKEQPWRLHTASDYLIKWMEMNQEGRLGAPRPLCELLLSGRPDRFLSGVGNATGGYRDFAPSPDRCRDVRLVKAAPVRKRPAATSLRIGTSSRVRSDFKPVVIVD